MEKTDGVNELRMVYNQAVPKIVLVDLYIMD